MHKFFANLYRKCFGAGVQPGIEVIGLLLQRSHSLPVGQNLWVDLRRCIGRDGVIFDVGANDGEWARRILSITNPKVIFCFEPTPMLAAQLLDSFSSSKVVVERKALGETSGFRKFYLYENPVYNGFQRAALTTAPLVDSLTVTVETLDQYMEDNQIGVVDLLKIDVEGFELEVLRGGGQAILAGRFKYILAEFRPWDDSFVHIRDHLKRYGYGIIGIYPGHSRMDYGMKYGDILLGRVSSF